MKSRPSMTAALVTAGSLFAATVACVSVLVLPMWNRYIEARHAVSQSAASGVTVFLVMCASGLCLLVVVLGKKGGE